MKKYVRIVAVSILLAGMTAGAGVAPGVPGAASAPAAGSATAVEAEVRKALLTVLNAIYSGDEKTALESQYLPNERAKRLAAADMSMGGKGAAWKRALAETFKAEKLLMPETLPPEVGQSIAAAKVTVTGETAKIEVEFYTEWMVREKGVWKRDVVKSLGASQSEPFKGLIEDALDWKMVDDQMIADVKAGKFQTSADAEKELTRRLMAADRRGGTAPTEAPIWATMSDIANLNAALDLFDIDNGRFPTTAEGLEALVKKPTGIGMDGWHPYLNRVPVDAWGQAYVYAGPVKETAYFNLSSDGPDGKAGTADDITRDMRPLVEQQAPAAVPVDYRVSTAMAELAILKRALIVFEIDTGRYPTTAEGLDALVRRPAGMDAQYWKGPYIAKVPLDPWGHPYIYATPGKGDADFDLTSAGPDGQAGTEDDIVRDTPPSMGPSHQ